MKQTITVIVAFLALCASASIVYYNFIYNHSKLRYEIQYIDIPLSETYRERLANYICTQRVLSSIKKPDPKHKTDVPVKCPDIDPERVLPPDKLDYVRFLNNGHRLSQKTTIKILAPGTIEDFEASSFDNVKVPINCRKANDVTLECDLGDYPSGYNISQVAIWHRKAVDNQQLKVVLKDSEEFGEEIGSLGELKTSLRWSYSLGFSLGFAITTLGYASVAWVYERLKRWIVLKR